MYMAKTEKKLHFPVGFCLICLFAAVVSVKGIGYTDGATPPPNDNSSIWRLFANVNQTSMLQIPAKRKSEKYDLALFKDGNKILTLLKNNSSIYVNTESIEEKQKNKNHFQMLLLNASDFEITIKGGTSYMYIRGNYEVRYYLDGKMPPEDPEPLLFSIEIINTTAANSTQDTNEEHSSPLRTGVPSPSIPLTTKTEINTTAEAKIVSTQGMNEEHPQHFHTGLSSPNTPLTPKTGPLARKTVPVPWEIFLAVAVYAVVLVVICLSVALIRRFRVNIFRIRACVVDGPPNGRVALTV